MEYERPAKSRNIINVFPLKFGGTPLPPFPPSLLFLVLSSEYFDRNDPKTSPFFFSFSSSSPLFFFTLGSVLSSLPSGSPRFFPSSSFELLSSSTSRLFFFLFKKLSNPVPFLGMSHVGLSIISFARVLKAKHPILSFR